MHGSYECIDSTVRHLSTGGVIYIRGCGSLYMGGVLRLIVAKCALLIIADTKVKRNNTCPEKQTFTCLRPRFPKICMYMPPLLGKVTQKDRP